MPLSAKTLLNLLVGIAAGALVWRLFLPDNAAASLDDGSFTARFAVVFGLALGLGLGVVGAWAADSQIEKWLSLALGGVCGLAGAALGNALGVPITNLIAHNVHGLSEVAENVLLALGQASGWGVLGLVLGGGLGGARRAWRLAWQGALGGFAGGLAGGIALVSLPQADMTVLGGLPLSSRDLEGQALGHAALGGLIGLGIALVPWLARQSWMQVLGGREHILARPLITLGRGTTCDIVLGGDSRVAPLHATIEAMPGGKHHLTVATGGGHFAPVTINGRAVAGEQWLANGDDLQIGSHALCFCERATRDALQIGPAQPEAWVPSQSIPPKPSPRLPSPAAERRSASPLPSEPYISLPIPSAPVPSLEPLPLLGLNRDMAALSLDETAVAPVGIAPLSALPALLSGIVLRAEQGPYVGRAFVVEASGITQIGRSIEREIPLPMDRTVSRLHAQIVPAGQGFAVEDAGSANGTFVNGLRLNNRHALHPGDVIQLGATVLRYT